MSCAACHTVFPELTSYGRDFKLKGYTAANTEDLKDGSDDTGYRLQMNNAPPIGAMLQISDTFVKNPASPGADLGSDNNGNLEFPTQFSFFYAGRISPKMGAFVQVTYDSASGAFAMDNTDVRLADSFKLGSTDLVLGLTANNNPTVQDVFNTIPAWSFPYSGNNSGFGAPGMTQLESLGGNVGGLGGYAFWNDLLYAEISAYRSAPQGFGGAAPGSYNAMQGFTPYWRVALTQDLDKNSIEVGAFGLDEHAVPNGSARPVGPQDHITDVGFDGQYQFEDKENIFTLKGSCIWENQVLDYANGVAATATNPTNTLQSFKLDATYYYDRKIGATVGYFSTFGTADSGLYPTLDGSGNPSDAANTPDTEGFILEANYVPWYNTKFGFQYTYFTKFNGSENNYDGAGRNASDNNTLMAMAWLMY